MTTPTTIKLHSAIIIKLTILPLYAWGEIQDTVLMVKFSRLDVIEYLKAKEGEINEAGFIVTGLVDGELFGGSDTIRVKDE